MRPYLVSPSRLIYTIILPLTLTRYTVVCGNDGGVDVTESTVVELDGVSVYISLSLYKSCTKTPVIYWGARE